MYFASFCNCQALEVGSLSWSAKAIIVLYFIEIGLHCSLEGGLVNYLFRAQLLSVLCKELLILNYYFIDQEQTLHSCFLCYCLFL